jgi:transcriptional regulator GlxA family with amidase domain
MRWWWLTTRESREDKKCFSPSARRRIARARFGYHAPFDPKSRTAWRAGNISRQVARFNSPKWPYRSLPTGYCESSDGLRLWLQHSAKAMNPKTVGLVVLEHVTAVDVTGPAEAFAQAKLRTGNQSAASGSPPVGRTRLVASFRRCYRVLILGVGSGPCVTDCGIEIKPHLRLEEAPALDTLFVCGCSQPHDPKRRRKLAKWLRHQAPVTRRVVGIGTGVHELAATGLLDGRQVAVHWRLANDVAQRFPNVRVNPDALFIKDGPFYSCAGAASAIDLSLSLIEEDFGRRIALNLARELVLHLKRSGEQNQCSDSLQFQLQSCDRFADIPTWILSNLDQDLSVEALAHRACMSPRNFARLFKSAFGKTPAEFVARLRITEARQRLLIPRSSIEDVAASIGFKSADAFSRTFERLVGVRPSTYRGRVGIVPANTFQKSQKAVLAAQSLARA